MPNADAPKVPPNCEEFFTPDPDGGAPEFWIDGHLSVPIDDAKMHYALRKVIACVAAQYWRAEADRLKATKKFEDSYEEFADAHQQILRWLRWGGLA